MHSLQGDPRARAQVLFLGDSITAGSNASSVLSKVAWVAAEITEVGYPFHCHPRSGRRHSELLSRFRPPVSRRMMTAGSRLAARRAAAMLTSPAMRKTVVTMLRTAASTAGAWPVRTRLASSRNVTSPTQ